MLKGRYKKVEDKTAERKNKNEDTQETPVMSEQAREILDKYREDLKRGKSPITQKNQADKGKGLDVYPSILEYTKIEYVVKRALLTCNRCTQEARKVKIDSVEYPGELMHVQMNSRIYVEDREMTINGKVPAGVKDCFGGLRGEEEKRKEAEEGEGKEDKKKKKVKVNIVSFGNCTCIPQGEELDKIIQSENLMDKKEKIKKAIENGKGTCYCFMNLNKEWENLPIPNESVLREMVLPKGGVEKKAFRSNSYLKFNEMEGIHMGSKLFCQFGQGIITALESGQNNVDTIIDPTDEKLLKILATIYGEAAGCSEMAWRVVAHAIMNRIGIREWDDYGTAYKIIENTGFEAFKDPNEPYFEVLGYLQNRDFANKRIERFLEVVLPIIMEEEEDITNNVTLFYSPNAQNKRNREAPQWSKSEAIEEVFIEGTESDDFRFFRYKD